MNNQLIAIFASYIFVFSVILFATLLKKYGRLSDYTTRKLVHIGVGNWVIYALFNFSDWFLAIIPPISFIVINYLSYRYKIFKAMELDEKNPGTVYYSISLAILTFFTFYYIPRTIFPYLGIMVMVWGDGFAALIGRAFPIKKLSEHKSIGGSLAFLVMSFLACYIYLYIFRGEWGVALNFKLALLFAVIGMYVEYRTRKNIDNLTVPLIVGILGLILERSL